MLTNPSALILILYENFICYFIANLTVKKNKRKLRGANYTIHYVIKT